MVFVTLPVLLEPPAGSRSFGSSAMTLNRDHVEKQLLEAKQRLEAWESHLDENGVAADDRKKDPKWRRFNSRCQAIQGRIDAVAALEARDAEVAKMTAEKAGSA